MSEEKKELTAEEKKALAEKVAEERAVKIELLVKLLKKNDEQSWITIKFLKMKLTQAEWNDVVTKSKVKQEIVDKAIKDFDMLKKHNYVPKEGTGTPRKNRFDGSPVEKLGHDFEQTLEDFLKTNEGTLKTLEAAGFAFQPFWRNLNNKGKKSANTPEPGE